MPKTMTLRNVPDKVATLLRQRARRNRRSIQAELLAILSETVCDRRSFEKQISEFRQSVMHPMSIEDIEQAIDTGRP